MKCLKKLMQKRILIPILVGLAVVICIVTAVCVIVGKEGKTVNENPETDEPVSESVSEPITEPATEASAETPTESEPTEPPTEAPTEPPIEPEVPKLAINYDLLDDIGLSCTELEEKRGAITSCEYPHGGLGYLYENGYGIYCFWEEPFTKHYLNIPDTDPLYDSLWKDENGYYIPLATEENKCLGIDYIKASDLFINEGSTVSLDDIRSIYGVEIETEAEEGLPGDRYSLYSSFRVEGYNSSIVLYHNDSEFIDMDSHVDIRINRYR